MTEFLATEARSALLSDLRDRSRVDYLHALLLPDAYRDAFITLRSFDAELRSVAARVNEPAMGEIRLQWWADGILGLRAGEMAQHPIGAALTSYLNGREHARKPLADKAEAHSADLYSDAPTDREAFEAYAGATRSTLWQLLALEQDKRGAPAAAGHLGVAEAVLDAIQTIPSLKAAGRMPVPLDILSECGMGADEWTDPAAIEAFAGYGVEHVAKAAEAGGPPELRFPGRLRYLAAGLEKARRRPELAVAGQLGVGPVRTQWLLWRN